jgi:2OG-Fe(II) oxygenase superfamily
MSSVSFDYTSYLLDCQYYPQWSLAHLGMSAEEIFEQVKEMDFADRKASHMRYRGNALKRSKFFLVNDLENVPVYLYPGFQYQSIVEEYGLIKDNVLATRFSNAIEKQFGVDINHIIGTRYSNGEDGIGYHSDKPKTINPDVPIYIFSCGAQRDLSFRKNGEMEAEIRIPMEAGSLFVLGHKTNNAYQHSIEGDKTENTRISMIFRDIKYRVEMKTIEKKASATVKRVNARNEKKEAGKKKYTIPARFRPVKIKEAQRE